MFIQTKSIRFCYGWYFESPLLVGWLAAGIWGGWWSAGCCGQVAANIYVGKGTDGVVLRQTTKMNAAVFSDK